MARTVPGSGAVIEPIFDEVFGVRAVKLVNGGSGYDPSDPPRLTIDGCGTPEREALLYPIIDQDSGRIVHVRVLERGRGYDPLRLQIIPTSETPNVIRSFDVNRIWQSHPNSPTSGTFQIINNDVSDRLRIVSDNHPKPTWTSAEAAPGGGPLVDRSFDQVFVYRGGKDVPFSGERLDQNNKSIGIFANGGLLHTPEWGTTGNTPVNFSLDSVKYDYVKNNNVYDAVTDSNIYYYQSSKVIDEFSQTGGLFEWGSKIQFTWNIKVELDNILVNVSNLDETLGSVEVGRIVDEIAGNSRAEIAKIVRDSNNNIIRLYLRSLVGTFEEGDALLGSNGFTFTISGVPTTFPNGIFYIDFGTEAAEFGPFVPGQYYFAPENIRVKRNYLIVWNQSDPSNSAGAGHPMRFSTTPDGPLNSNPGTLYYTSTGVSQAPAADYENEYQPLFIMNADETNRIYYYCGNHRHMSGYVGDEGYMILDPEVENETLVNNYYVENYYQADENDPNTIDYSRHVDGHSKILGMSFDGYPIYGPYGYTTGKTVGRMVPSYRLRTTNELAGARPVVTTASTVTYTVTVSNNKFLFDGSTVNLLNLQRGKTYIFNQDDSSNDNEYLLISDVSDGWHSQNPVVIGNTANIYDLGVSYYLDGSSVTYANYISGFNSATQREIRFEVPATAPTLLYVFAYNNSNRGNRTIQGGYQLGDLIQDYIYDPAVSGATLDQYNGKFGVTPEYPNGTYAYFMTEDSSGNPLYPYVIGPQYYGEPIFEGGTVPAVPSEFPTEATGDVVLHEEDVYGFDDDGNSVVVAPAGSVAYIKMTRNGDNFFGTAKAFILGGEGSGATCQPTTQTVTGLSLLGQGRNYQTPPTLIFEGGGGVGAQGAAEIDTLGKVTSINVVDSGEFYQEPPYVLISGGGGLGAKAVARIEQGEVIGIDVIEPGSGYTSPPNVIFTKLVNLKRKTRARQSFNSTTNYFSGLLKDVGANDSEIYIKSTDSFPGSGQIILNSETISYTSKSRQKLSGLTRGVNFNYDQRVILDPGQNDPSGVSTYKFSVGDRVIRRVENASNKIAKVYDWDPSTRELLVVFEVDELAFIDGGIPSTEDAIVQFDAGVANSSGTGVLPHTIEIESGSVITLLTTPITTLQDRKFRDEVGDVDSDGNPTGDGIPDLINTGTQFESQISLDGGIYNSLYGIEETQGGTNTTLFQVGDNIKDASIPFEYATVVEAGGLSEGVEHASNVTLTLDPNNSNGQNFSVNEIVTGSVSGIRGTVVSWDASTSQLVLNNIVPYNTGNVNIGVSGLLYEFSSDGTIVDFIIQDSGTNYTLTPTVEIENVGDIQATGTVVMTSAGDQVSSITITNGGYGIEQSVDNTYVLHPTVTFTNGVGDTTGAGAVAQAVLGGENVVGNGGATYRIKSIDYSTSIRSESS